MTAKGFVVKNMTVKVAGNQYECEVTGVTETESHDTQTQAVACGDSATDVGPASWTVDVSANIDMAATSLFRVLRAAAQGTPMVVEWVPDVTGHPTIKATANVKSVKPPGDFTVGSFAAFTVSLPCDAEPVYT